MRYITASVGCSPLSVMSRVFSISNQPADDSWSCHAASPAHMAVGLSLWLPLGLNSANHGCICSGLGGFDPLQEMAEALHNVQRQC